MKMQVENILEDLIRFPSLQGNSEGILNCIKYIQDILSTLGFTVIVREFPDKILALYAFYGNGAPNLCFAGHIDVVPPGNETLWTSLPFVPTAKAGNLYGRGTVDMKGAIATMIIAAQEFVTHNQNINGSLSFLITSDEETSQIGTPKMLETINSLGHSIECVIIGEPTSDKIIGDQILIGRRGSMNFYLTVHGRQGHVAHPEDFDNPNTMLIDILHHLQHEKLDAGNKLFNPSLLQVTSIDVANTTTNIVPDNATARFNIRFNDNYTRQTLKDKITGIIKQYTNHFVLEESGQSTPSFTPINDFVSTIQSIISKTMKVIPKVSTHGGVSDSLFFRKYGSSVVELGLFYHTAHQINEYVGIQDLKHLQTLYVNILHDILK